MVILIITLFAVSANAYEKNFPFKPGERLKYVLKWGVIPAGEAVLEVRPMADLNGKQAYHFVMTVKTNSFVDVFYKVRDRIDAYTDIDMNHSLLYKKKQREGGYKRDIVVNFDWGKNQAQYTNRGKKKDSIQLMPKSFDPLSALYFTRLVDMEPNSQIFHPVTDGQKNVVGVAHIIKRETIKVAGHTYDTFLIEPELKHVGGVFKVSKNAKIQLWVTADNRRIPVRIKSKVVVGSFIGELVSAEGF